MPPLPPRRDDKEPEEESDFSEEEDSEEEEPVRDAEVKVESKEGRRDWRGSERPPEPLHPPEGKSKKRGKKRGHRGGARHQKHHRSAQDPFRKSHRRLDQERLELARDFRGGRERRA